MAKMSWEWINLTVPARSCLSVQQEGCMHCSREVTANWHVGSGICSLPLLWSHQEELWESADVECRHSASEPSFPLHKPSTASGQLPSPAELCFKPHLYFPFGKAGTKTILDGSQSSPELFSLTSSCSLTTGALMMSKDDCGQWRSVDNCFSFFLLHWDRLKETQDLLWWFLETWIFPIGKDTLTQLQQAIWWLRGMWRDTVGKATGWREINWA